MDNVPTNFTLYVTAIQDESADMTNWLWKSEWTHMAITKIVIVYCYMYIPLTMHTPFSVVLVLKTKLTSTGHAVWVPQATNMTMLYHWVKNTGKVPE